MGKVRKQTIEFDIAHRIEVTQILYRLAESVPARKLLIQLAIALSPEGMARTAEADRAYKILINVTANWDKSVKEAEKFYEEALKKVRSRKL